MSRARRRPTFSSTNVRLAALRGTLGALARVTPSLAAAVAERLFFTPPPARSSRGERLLRSAQPIRVVVEGRPVMGWRWGRGPAVGLLHGWGGQAAQLTSFVPPLVARGLSAVAFDAPGHGRSGRGRSSAPQFARALRAVADAVGGMQGLVAHSLGAAGAALALNDGLRIPRVVFVGASADPPRWVASFAMRLGLPDPVVDGMRQRSERRIGRSWRELHVPTLAAGFEAALMVIHDRDDREVPFADAAAIAGACPRATLVETTGLGHNGVLRDPDTVARAVDFLTEGLVTVCACGRPALEAGGCEDCRFERELFDRELRWASTAAA